MTSTPVVRYGIGVDRAELLNRNMAGERADLVITLTRPPSEAEVVWLHAQWANAGRPPLESTANPRAFEIPQLSIDPVVRYVRELAMMLKRLPHAAEAEQKQIDERDAKWQAIKDALKTVVEENR
ncbi:hypothetical protein [Allobranchiibius sp. GilTou73]|uniref:hypothetical protein n=1 Tax=Allobranchiibius sp. GilTou73 TaxID=2904523 RepID=UPI001F2BEFC0|nr:hypothetical protein [Allobranchiibius sp. GilTou73]UIJ34494.1 hypothetical protein LVQ62_15495 [Allobranchiibius sp. GilTou73]